MKKDYHILISGGQLRLLGWIYIVCMLMAIGLSGAMMSYWVERKECCQHIRMIASVDASGCVGDVSVHISFPQIII